MKPRLYTCPNGVRVNMELIESIRIDYSDFSNTHAEVIVTMASGDVVAWPTNRPLDDIHLLESCMMLVYWPDQAKVP